MRLWDALKSIADGVEDDGSYDSPDGPEDCEARRSAALRVTADELDLPADWGSRPYGIVLEVGAPRGVVTVVAFATGESSLLTSGGSGIIGRPNHVHVVVQAKRLVKVAADHVSLLEPAVRFPPPRIGATRFYVLTRDGVLTAEEPVAMLRSGESPLSPLLETGDELISEFLQYGWSEVPIPPSTPSDYFKAFAMVAGIAALTYAAWLIPFAWLRWPAVAVGIFFTIAALIVPYAMLTAPRLTPDRPAGTAA